MIATHAKTKRRWLDRPGGCTEEHRRPDSKRMLRVLIRPVPEACKTAGAAQPERDLRIWQIGQKCGFQIVTCGFLVDNNSDDALPSEYGIIKQDEGLRGMRFFFAAITGMALLGACTEETRTPTETDVASQDACSAVSGDWQGEKTGGGYQGPITISIAENCSYRWVGTSGLITPGRLRATATGFSYFNNAGSRGLVSISEGNMTWVNTYTGNNYKVVVRRQ